MRYSVGMGGLKYSHIICTNIINFSYKNRYK